MPTGNNLTTISVNLLTVYSEFISILILIEVFYTAVNLVYML